MNFRFSKRSSGIAATGETMNLFKKIFRGFRKKPFYTKDILRKKNCTFGEHTYGRPEILQFGEEAQLSVGRFCSIAPGVKIFLGGNHRKDWVTTYPFPALVEAWPEAAGIPGHPATRGDVVIGNDVWIGYGATILSGVRIGDGAIIGTQAVVARDVEPYAIVAGNPALPVGKRFDEETVRKLLAIRWWEWPEEKIRKNMELLCSGRLGDFLNEHAQHGATKT
jgi:acetyltransferase-like isoleucine patch superfamily enzyme